MDHFSSSADKAASHEQIDTLSASSAPISTKPEGGSLLEQELISKLDKHSLEAIVEMKIARFLDQIGTFYPEDLHDLIMAKVEKPLIGQILRRTGGNQVHASKILGINRNTLRKKMKIYGFSG